MIANGDDDDDDAFITIITTACHIKYYSYQIDDANTIFSAQNHQSSIHNRFCSSNIFGIYLLQFISEKNDILRH